MTWNRAARSPWLCYVAATPIVGVAAAVREVL